MATTAQFRDFFRTYNPSGGGREEWNMWCQAFVARCTKTLGGTFKRDYGTARAARLASGWLNPDLSSAPVGAIGWWLWPNDDHVAVYMGGNVWMMGSRHVTTQFGGVALNAGLVSHADFQRSAGLQFLGWSATNGGNTVSVTIPAPAADQRVVVAMGANRRVSPDGGAKFINVVAPNSTQTISGWQHGSSHEGTDVWFEVGGYGWSHSAGFTSRAVTGIRDKTPAPPVVVPEPEPEPTPEPEPEMPTVAGWYLDKDGALWHMDENNSWHWGDNGSGIDRSGNEPMTDFAPFAPTETPKPVPEPKEKTMPKQAIIGGIVAVIVSGVIAILARLFG